ncbi:hypothetical protein PROFUN_08099 [Planoprotostelium fungivorum]|uniref:Uncharacterized protein n=1 Tax=Planoprotostelium fungivorum TaxID=1890364 RepID=A0A2P6NKH3_9EUKA|nr:hypothetical protein PROFUN_08099 [Planoprotostelium fungivorum]
MRIAIDIDTIRLKTWLTPLRIIGIVFFILAFAFALTTIIVPIQISRAIIHTSELINERYSDLYTLLPSHDGENIYDLKNVTSAWNGWYRIDLSRESLDDLRHLSDVTVKTFNSTVKTFSRPVCRGSLFFNFATHDNDTLDLHFSMTREDTDDSSRLSFCDFAGQKTSVLSYMGAGLVGFMFTVLTFCFCGSSSVCSQSIGPERHGLQPTSTVKV